MKTLWILDHHSSEPEHNGISRHYDFARELGNMGVNVVVIASSYSHFSFEYFKKEEFAVSEISDRVRYVYLKTRPQYTGNGKKRFLNMVSYVGLVNKYKGIISQKYGKPDSVLGCSIHPLAWVAAYRTARALNGKFYIEVRDFWPLFFLESGQYKRWHPIVAFFSTLEKWAYKKAHKIIVSLPFADKYLTEKLGIPKEKIFWIGQPMDYKRFDENVKDNQKIMPEEIRDYIKDSFVCVFSGNYQKYEGVMTMLEAASILSEKNKNIKMLFVGDGNAKDEMLEYVEKNKLSNVLISERIPKLSIPPLLKRCQIKMAALYTENPNSFAYGISKNKINEYLYSGGCTIFGFLQPNSAVELSNGGYVIPPNEPIMLAETILKVFSLPKSEFNRISENARRYILEQHGVDLLAERVKKILLE